MILVGRFRENRNATTIEYKKFAATDDDRYPTFSICFKGNGLYRYNGSILLRAYGTNVANYEKMLNGQPAFRYDYDPTRMLYEKTSLPSSYETDVTFEDMVQRSHDISNIVNEARFEVASPGDSVFYEKAQNSNKKFAAKIPFYIGYQAPKIRCLTRESTNDIDWIRMRDKIYLDVPFLDFNTVVDVIIHYPGQLMKNLDNPSLTSESDVMKDKGLQLKISDTTVLKKRSVKGQLCSNNIADYDTYFHEAMINKIGCIPPFWMKRMKDTSRLKECTSPEKLWKVNDLIGNYKIMLDEIEAPCVDMFNSIGWNWLKVWSKRIKNAFIEIIYVEKYYAEITQVEDFNFQDFISNLGGFIGIFLGYSMMQIPDLMSKSDDTYCMSMFVY